MKIIGTVFLLLLTSCNYEAIHQPAKDIGSGQGQGQGACANPGEPSPDVITYDLVKVQIFEPRCFSCHGGGSASGGVSLGTYEAAKQWATQIKFDVVNNIMPKAPNPPLSTEEKDLVVAWVDTGALNSVTEGIPCEGGPENGGAEGETPDDPVDEFLKEVPPDAEITYFLVREKIFKFRCFACHSTAGGNADGLNLETYFNAIDELEDIYEEVAEGNMPPPPRPALNSIERRTILRWIELGAPNK